MGDSVITTIQLHRPYVYKCMIAMNIRRGKWTGTASNCSRVRPGGQHAAIGYKGMTVGPKGAARCTIT
jgi:hypothetical protein